MLLYSSYNEYSYYDYCLYCSMNNCKPADFESEECQDWFKEQHNNDIQDYIDILLNSKIKDRKFILTSQTEKETVLFNNIKEFVDKLKSLSDYDIVIYTTEDSKRIGKISINIYKDNRIHSYFMYMFKDNIINASIDNVRNHITDYIDNIKEEDFFKI